MQPITRERLTRNAYRTLGVGASSTQSAVEASVRRMRLWPDAAMIPPTPWDIAVLGDIARSPRDIDRAVVELMEPESRVEHRLLWFHGKTPPTEGWLQQLGASTSLPGSDVPPAQRHEEAVGALYAAYAFDSTMRDASRWQNVLARLHDLAASRDYVDWVIQCEADGDFEKRASVYEIEAAIAALPDALASAMLPVAEKSLSDGDMFSYLAMQKVLTTVGPTEVTEAKRSLLLDRVEDVIVSRCRDQDQELRDKLRTDHSDPAPYFLQNDQATRPAAGKYDETIRSAQQEYALLAGDDMARLARVNDPCAELQGLIALGWEWAGRTLEAKAVLEEAIELAVSFGQRAQLQKALDRVRLVVAQPPTARPVVTNTLPPPPPFRTRKIRWRYLVLGVAVFFLGSCILTSFMTPWFSDSGYPQKKEPPALNLTGTNSNFEPSTTPLTTRPAESVSEVNREP